MKRLFTTSGVLCFTVAAFALGSFFSVAKSTYKFAEGSPAAKAMCMLCHTSKMGGATKLNAYGLDVKAALKGSKTLTPTVLHSLDGKKGKSGETYGALLKAGKLPA